MEIFSRHQTRILLSVAVLSVLVTGMAVGVMLVAKQQGYFDTRRQASANKVDLSLNGPASINTGDTVSVNVIVTETHGLPVTATDIRLSFDATKLRLDSITKGTFFAQSDMATTPPAGFDKIGNELLKDIPSARYALGALCDYCYLGSPDPNYPDLQACSSYSITTPACYPKASPGTLATYTFTALASGDTSIGFIPDTGNNDGTQVAILNASTNDVGDLNALALTITTPASLSCAADLVNNQGEPSPDGYVNGADFSYLVGQFDAFNLCSQ